MNEVRMPIALEMKPLPLFVAVPPTFDRRLGYTGRRRFIGIYWDCLLDDCVISDGIGHFIGCRSAWNALLEQRLAKAALAPFDFGSAHAQPAHLLVLDRHLHCFSVLPYGQGEAFVLVQGEVSNSYIL